MFSLLLKTDALKNRCPIQQPSVIFALTNHFRFVMNTPTIRF